MSDDKKVVSLFRGKEPDETTAQGFERIVKAIEANEAEGARITSGIITIMYDNGRIEMFHVGGEYDTLRDLAVVRLAEELILDEIMG